MYIKVEKGWLNYTDSVHFLYFLAQIVHRFVFPCVHFSFVYVYLHVYECVYLHVYECVYLRVYDVMCICMCTSVCISMYMGTRVYVWVHVEVRLLLEPRKSNSAGLWSQLPLETLSPPLKHRDLKQTYAPTQHLCGCWRSELWSLYLWNMHLTHWATFPASGGILFIEFSLTKFITSIHIKFKIM